MLDRVIGFLKGLPKPALYGGLAVFGVFALALIVGLINRPAATAATVSTVRPAQAPMAAAVQPFNPGVAAPAAPSAPSGPVPMVAAAGATMRPAQNIDVARLTDCARESLALPDSESFSLDKVRFVAAIRRDECKSPTLSLSSAAHGDFAPYLKEGKPFQLARSGVILVEKQGQYTFFLSGKGGVQELCALYIDDMTAPLVSGGDYHGEFSSLAVAGLEAGPHEVALVCSFNPIPRYITPPASAVTVTMREAGEPMPRQLALKLAPEPAQGVQ